MVKKLEWSYYWDTLYLPQQTVMNHVIFLRIHFKWPKYSRSSGIREQPIRGFGVINNLLSPSHFTVIQFWTRISPLILWLIGGWPPVPTKWPSARVYFLWTPHQLPYASKWSEKKKLGYILKCNRVWKRQKKMKEHSRVDCRAKAEAFISNCSLVFLEIYFSPFLCCYFVKSWSVNIFRISLSEDLQISKMLSEIL